MCKGKFVVQPICQLPIKRQWCEICIGLLNVKSRAPLARPLGWMSGTVFLTSSGTFRKYLKTDRTYFQYHILEIRSQNSSLLELCKAPLFSFTPLTTLSRLHYITLHYKTAVLSQRWPRDARYISRSWAVVDIWPFKIVQDCGGRHLEFVRIENSAIRSAVPENPTL